MKKQKQMPLSKHFEHIRTNGEMIFSDSIRKLCGDRTPTETEKQISFLRVDEWAQGYLDSIDYNNHPELQ